MKPHCDLPELLDAAVADHRLMVQLLDSYQQFNSADEQTAEAVTVGKILRLVNAALIDHIHEEDRRVYPAVHRAFVDRHIHENIAEIQEEHPILVQKAKRVNQVLIEEQLRHSPPVQAIVLDFVAFLMQHSVKEDVLFRLIRQTPPGATALNLTLPPLAPSDGVTA